MLPKAMGTMREESRPGHSDHATGGLYETLITAERARLGEASGTRAGTHSASRTHFLDKIYFLAEDVCMIF